MLIGDRGSIASMLPSGRKFWRKQVAGATFAGAFSRDLTARGQPLPPTVSLRELVSGGYIAAADLRAFDGMDVTISLTADEARPQEILIRVRMPDGSVTALLADGSIQGLRR